MGNTANEYKMNKEVWRRFMIIKFAINWMPHRHLRTRSNVFLQLESPSAPARKDKPIQMQTPTMLRNSAYGALLDIIHPTTDERSNFLIDVASGLSETKAECCFSNTTFACAVLKQEHSSCDNVASQVLYDQ